MVETSENEHDCLFSGGSGQEKGPNPEDEQLCSFSGLVTVRVVQTLKTNRRVRFRGWWLSLRWRDGLQLAFKAREGLVVGANPLCHPNRKREDGGWQVKPPTRVSSEGGAGSGCESPPSPKSQAGGWWLAGKASHWATRVLSEGGWVQIPSVTQIASGRVVVGW